jgi:hypothetical protein
LIKSSEITRTITLRPVKLKAIVFQAHPEKSYAACLRWICKRGAGVSPRISSHLITQVDREIEVYHNNLLVYWPDGQLTAHGVASAKKLFGVEV